MTLSHSTALEYTSRRLNKLINSDLLRIIGVVDPVEFGYSVAVIITIDVELNKLKSAMVELANIQAIKWLSTCTGRSDIIAMARFRSTDALSDFLSYDRAELEGIRNCETYICLNVTKGRYVAALSEE